MPGEKVAFVGESGCGKTTITKLISRFYECNNGKILIDDIPINSLSLNTLRQSIGIVFQDIYIFGTTIKENILFGNPESSEDEIIQAAKAAFLHEYIMELPDQYNTKVGEKGVILSGGLKQRLGLARLFLMNPSIIILDEPTSSLDYITEKQIQKSLEKFLIGKTVITIAHRLSTIRNYDQIFVIDNGEIKESGSHEHLLAKNGLYKNFLIQTKEARAHMKNTNWIWNYIKHQKLLYFLTIFLLILESISFVYSITLQQSIIDEVILGGNYREVWRYIILIAFCYLIFIILFVVNPYLQSKIHGRVKYNLVKQGLTTLYHTPLSKIQKERDASYVHFLTNEISIVARLIGEDISDIVKHLVSTVIICVLFLKASPILFLSIFILSLFYIKTRKNVITTTKESLEKYTK